MVKTVENIKEMKAAKKQEEYQRPKSYDEGKRDGWIHALDWFLGE